MQHESNDVLIISHYMDDNSVDKFKDKMQSAFEMDDLEANFLFPREGSASNWGSDFHQSRNIC